MAGAKQSLTNLRGLAQAMGVKWAFSDDYLALKQKIDARQIEMLPSAPLPVITAPSDQRLRTLPPSKVSSEQMLRTVLRPYVDRGLQLTIEDDWFTMRHGTKTDSGTLRQPPRVIVECARRLFQ